MAENEERDSDYLERIAKDRVSVIQPNAAIILVAGIAIGLFIGIRNDMLVGTVVFWVFSLVLAVVLNVVLVRRKRRELLTDLKGS